MKAALTLLAIVAVVAAEEVGHNKVLNFPNEDTTTNFLLLRFNPDIEETSAFTACAWLRKSTIDNSRYWLSYAVSGSDNEIIMGENDAGTVVFYIKNTKLSTAAGIWPVNVWTHVCASWDASSRAFITVNGEVAASQDGFRAGDAITAGGTLVLGQEQDSVGGSFDAGQCFQGDIYNLNIWQYALSEEEVAFLYNSGRCGFGETEDEPQVPYSVIYGQEPQGGAQFVDGSCLDLDDFSSGRVLRFPPQSDISLSNYVRFTADFGVDALTSLSLCTWYFKSFSDSSRYVFSYAVSGDDNVIILGENSNVVGFWLRRSRFLTSKVLEQQTWYHICATWSTDSGIAIYVDGENVGETADQGIGSSVPSGGIIVLGQEQDSLGGRFDINQAFSGSIYNMNIFNVKLSAEEVALIYGDGSFCQVVPDQFWTDERIALSYSTIASVAPSGNAVFEHGDDAWKHGAQICGSDDIAEVGHRPECWEVHENKRFKKKSGSMGSMVALDVETAMAACFASQTCRALTCQDMDGEVKCEMRSSFKKAKQSAVHTSYVYVC